MILASRRWWNKCCACGRSFRSQTYARTATKRIALTHGWWRVGRRRILIPCDGGIEELFAKRGGDIDVDKSERIVRQRVVDLMLKPGPALRPNNQLNDTPDESFAHPSTDEWVAS